MTQKRHNTRRIVRAIAVIALISAKFAYAQVTLNFVNADIDQVAKAIGAATGKTIIVDPRVKGQLNLVSEQPVSRERALKTLQSALRMQGFALLQDHGVLKVVPEADAKLQGVPTYQGNVPQARGDQVITQVFQLRHESANSLLPVLRPLISPNNTIAAYPANNSLVVTDYADNVQRIAKIIASVDSNASQNVEMVTLKHANALDLALQVQKMLDPATVGNPDATLKVNVIADLRTNSLLLRASDTSRLAMAKALIAKLDKPTREPGNIHVVPLRNADAVQLAKTLHRMLGQGNDNQSATSNENNSFKQSDSGDASSALSTGTPGLPPLPSGSSSGGSPLKQGSGPDFNSNKQSNEDNQPGGIVQADTATNSLIITATEPTYRNLRNVIDQLDVRRAQVYIEALIVDMSIGSDTDLGIQWQGVLLSRSSNNALIGGTNYGDNGNIIGLTGAINGLIPPTAPGLIRNGLNVGYLHKFGNILGVGGLLNALSQVKGANVLSTPSLTTLDNEESRIMVGANVPVVSGSYASLNSGGDPRAFNTIDRLDIGIVLYIKPQITEGGILKLQLYQEDSSVQPETILAQNGPTIMKRSIKSTVLADDGEIIVLGGLIRDSYIENNNKVPGLGDLPVIGALFRSETKTRARSNLLVFLRPVILQDNQAASAVSLNRYDYIRATSNNYSSDNWWARDKDLPQPPPAPPGPQQGAMPTENLFDLTRMNRSSNQAPPLPNPVQPPAKTPSSSSLNPTPASSPAMVPSVPSRSPWPRGDQP